MGSAMISWLSKKQSNVALNTADVEYIIVCSSICESIWILTLLSYLFDLEMDANVILCDNQSCMKMTESPMFHDRVNHIEIGYVYIRDMVHQGAMKLQYVSTNE